MVCGKAAFASAKRVTGIRGALASGTGSGAGDTGRIAGAADGGGDPANCTTGSLTDSNLAVRDTAARAREGNHSTSTRAHCARNADSCEADRASYSRTEGFHRRCSRGDFDSGFDAPVASGFGRL